MVTTAFIDTPETQRANRRFIKKVMTKPLLSEEHERDLARRWRDHQDVNALHELTGAYIRLVVSMATRFRNYGLPVSDLVQEGNVGLMQAAARFDPDRNVRFSTYAGWWIRAAIQDFVLRNWSIVRTGTTAAHKSLFFNLRRLKARIANGTRDKLTPDDRQSIAENLGVNVIDVEKMETRLSASDRSLNVVPGGQEDEGGSTWQELLVCDAPTPSELVEETNKNERVREWIEGAFEHLNPRERAIISERRLSDQTVTLEQLGTKFGISKERVRQIENRALEKMKAAITEKIDDPVAATFLSA
ncbi:MAG: RNA polymerase factor sigma-32 [Parvibaculaceae bacterium]|jgi:RNA polymerase sigma-32 factor|nr:RNA polymerase factor sigma-32 [Parvibaculaceae bacterium]